VELTMNEDTEDTRTYAVVINQEQQYSIWLASREIPAGWREVGKTGTRTECLDYLDHLDHLRQTWTDMRPLSLRKSIDDP
jgi:MbtH protein